MDPLLHEPADAFAIAAYVSVWVNVGRYHREALIASVGDMAAGATLDIALWEASDAAGTGAALIAGKQITQLTQAGGDGDELPIISLRNEELTPGNAYVQVRFTVAGAQVELAYILLGLVADYEPVPTTRWGEIIA
jgi:hypothetical protein